MLFAFALTMGVLVLGASISLLVMGQVQSVVDDFIVQDFPRSQRIRDLNHLVEGVALSAQRLSHARTKADLEESFDQIDALLLRLDATADEVSRGGVDSETLQITRQLQVLRSEAQLGFQLRGVALDLQGEMRRVETRGLEWSSRLANLALPVGSDGPQGPPAYPPSARRAVLRSAQRITTLLARSSISEDPSQGSTEEQMQAEIATLRAIRQSLPAGETR